ncbi:YdbL family protein [Leclercia adecarboxylata]|uniref:YdbL family protein n=1 Tax=Leclercia adecarboxylata TaxID=83655 RepID=UPI002DB9424A|nr:YdbL family protein [Leclercia adecarboxylata]MEB6377906.1 YdbL family protein [Leclercia adecarboxylata]
MRKPIALLILTLGICAPALALTLNEARTAGRVGETLSGYIAPRSQDSETLALVEQINKARTDSYQKLADSNNIPVDEVAKMAGTRLVARARPGEYVQGVNGRWLQK